jgi:hypothetical protein
MFVPVGTLFEATKSSMVPGQKGFEGPWQHVPSQTRHCVVAVMKRGKTATDAWRICRWAMKKHGFMKSDDPGEPSKENMRMTQRGVRAQPRHTFEKGGKAKHDQFAKSIGKIKFK